MLIQTTNAFRLKIEAQLKYQGVMSSHCHQARESMLVLIVQHLKNFDCSGKIFILITVHVGLTMGLLENA